MNQFMSWICLLSICFLSLQVMIFICNDTVKLFNKVTFHKKKSIKKSVTSSAIYNYKNKIAK